MSFEKMLVQFLVVVVAVVSGLFVYEHWLKPRPDGGADGARLPVASGHETLGAGRRT